MKDEWSSQQFVYPNLTVESAKGHFKRLPASYSNDLFYDVRRSAEHRPQNIP
jgi:hypothetical protein